MSRNDGGMTPARKMTAAERQRQTLQLKAQGFTFDEIAAKLGYANSGGAYKAFTKAVRDIPKQEAEQYRHTADLRWDKMTRTVWNRAMRGDTYAIDTILKIEAQRAKMFGLNLEADQGPGTTIQKAYFGIPIEDL